MIATYLQKRISPDLLYAALGIVLICILFVLMVPRVQILVFPQARHAQYEQFLNNIQGQKGVDIQTFLSFRDMYGLGSLTFNHHVLTPEEFGMLEQENLAARVATTAAEFSRYTSPRVTSVDYTLDPFQFASIYEVYPVPKSKIIHDGPNFTLYRESPRTVKLVFIVPFSQFTDISGEDFFAKNTNLYLGWVKNSYWMDISTIHEQ